MAPEVEILVAELREMRQRMDLLIFQAKPTYTLLEVCLMAGYKKENYPFIQYCEEKGYLKPIQRRNKRYSAKDFVRLRNLLSQGEVQLPN